MNLRKIKKTVIIFILLSPLLLIVVSNYLVTANAENVTYASVQKIPFKKVGLLLGTGKYLKSGGINPYYKNRIEAAVKLFKSRKIDFILVSGDNSTKSYDEPSSIREDLINKGIDSSKIFLDYAGFRTLDSIVRCKEIFGQTDITVISQKFHNERAIYIASKKGINAQGFNAKDTSFSYGLKVHLRELLARVKMMIDLTLNVQPKFLGEKIQIQ